MHRFGRTVIVRRPDTGRTVVLDAETWERHVAGAAPGVALALERAGFRDPTPLTDWIPVRWRAALTLPDRGALWAPHPLRPTAGGHAWREVPLAPGALALWGACNDARTVAEVARAARLDPAAALRHLAELTAFDRQLVTLRRARPAPADPSPWGCAGPPRPAHARAADPRGPDGATALGAWHHDLDDADTRFDDAETTVAHAWARPSGALRGVPYGARLRERLRARGLPVDGPVVEVGCGTGELCRDWAPDAPWLRVDLSPALLARQARTAPRSAGVLADGTRLPLPGASVPFLLSNEVLADLPSVPVDRAGPEVDALLSETGAAPEAPGSWYNVGAWRLVAEVARVLAPGGGAVLTEFGGPDEPPSETVQLDHAEVSIRFDRLAALAVRRGLSAELVRLDDLLGVDPAARHLCRIHWEGVRALWHRHGGRVEARGWSAADVPLPEAVEGLVDEPVTRPGPGPLVTRFWALLLRRPAAAAG